MSKTLLILFSSIVAIITSFITTSWIINNSVNLYGEDSDIWPVD